MPTSDISSTHIEANMDLNETMSEQIRRQNLAAAELHEAKRIQALNRVHELRRQLKEKEQNVRNVIPQ